MQRLYSAVVDPIGPYPEQVRRLVWSLTKLAGVDPSHIVLHVVEGKSDPLVRKSLQKLGVEIVPIEAYPGHAYCNKLQQLPSLLKRDFQDVVLLDCDLLVLEEPPAAEGRVLAKPVDYANPPMEILENLLQLAGLPIIPAKTDVDGAPTIRANANGGVYVIDRICFESLSEAWRKWVDWCFQRIDHFGEYWMHIDQVAFALAITEREIPFAELDRRFNVPTHVKQPSSLDCIPAILHYHRALDSQQLLLPVETLPRVNETIREINNKLLEDRRSALDNVGFWNTRYALHSELGSGIGSRGETLAKKQKLLQRIVNILNVDTVLDIGGGDGQTIQCLPQEITLYAADLAMASKPLYMAANPRALWMQHDITSDPSPVKTDLVVCLDLLIHLSDPQEYATAVRNLLASGSYLLVSGFDARPVDFGPMTYFHEPISVSLSRYGVIPIPVYAYRGVTVFLVISHNFFETFRGLSPETLIKAIPHVAEPLLLVEALFNSKNRLGFFPDHLPRCIEYPWIVAELAEKNPMRIADVGAGVSVLPFLLSNRGHSVLTIDSHPMIRNTMPPESWNEWGFLDYSEIDPQIHSLHSPYQDTSDNLQLDALVSVNVIEHLTSDVRRACIDKATKQLIPGGHILLTVDTEPFTENLWNYADGIQVEAPEKHGTLSDLISELSDRGFLIEKIERSNWLPQCRVGMVRIHGIKRTFQTGNARRRRCFTSIFGWLAGSKYLIQQVNHVLKVVPSLFLQKEIPNSLQDYRG